MIKLVKVVETCPGLPAQWDAWDETGQYYYLRYRFGRATVEKFASNDPTTWGPLYPSGEALVASWETEKRKAGERDYDGGVELPVFLERVGGFELAPDAEIIPWDVPEC
jgi:hypothetical protein